MKMDNAHLFDAQVKYFDHKAIMIVVPHPDDEINIAGGLLHFLGTIDVNITVVYTTNGNFRNRGEERVNEAKKSVALLTGGKGEVIFLGYTDQKSSNGDHLFNSTEEWKDRWDNHHTYLCGDEEYCYIKHNLHKVQNRDNFIEDIKEVIYEFKPDIIWGIDLDSHPDHKATSIALEYAIGELLQETDYRPFVFKTFAYPTAYKGAKDFFSSQLYATRFVPEFENSGMFQNPYYDWDNRVRFLLLNAARDRRLRKNIIYKALKCHRSQNIVDRVDRIINNDQIAWMRSTDGLAYSARLVVSSGEAACLNDFVLLDCFDITEESISGTNYNKNTWHPQENDNSPFITMEFRKSMEFNNITLYFGINCTRKVKAKIIVPGIYEQPCENREDNLIWSIDLPQAKSDRVTIMFVDNDISIAEVEVYNNTENEKLWSYPLINGNINYEQVNISVQTGEYYFNGVCGKTVDNSEDLNNGIDKYMLNRVNVSNQLLLYFWKCYHYARKIVQKTFGKF